MGSFHERDDRTGGLAFQECVHGPGGVEVIVDLFGGLRQRRAVDELQSADGSLDLVRSLDAFEHFFGHLGDGTVANEYGGANRQND